MVSIKIFRVANIYFVRSDICCRFSIIFFFYLLSYRFEWQFYSAFMPNWCNNFLKNETSKRLLTECLSRVYSWPSSSALCDSSGIVGWEWDEELNAIDTNNRMLFLCLLSLVRRPEDGFRIHIHICLYFRCQHAMCAQRLVKIHPKEPEREWYVVYAVGSDQMMVSRLCDVKKLANFTHPNTDSIQCDNS